MVKGGRLRKTLPKIRQLAYVDKSIAYAVLGQAILDESDIGQTSVTIAYGVIGPLPDDRKDQAFRRLLIYQPSGRHKYKRGEAKRLILQLLQKEGPMSRRELMYRLGIRGGTVGAHLQELKKKGDVTEALSDSGFGRRQSSKLWRVSADLTSSAAF